MTVAFIKEHVPAFRPEGAVSLTCLRLKSRVQCDKLIGAVRNYSRNEITNITAEFPIYFYDVVMRQLLTIANLLDDWGVGGRFDLARAFCVLISPQQ